MKGKPLKNWDDFEEEIYKLEPEREAMIKNDEDRVNVTPLLFRGQANSSWELESTLSRYVKKEMRWKEYYTLIYNVKSQIEKETGKTWDISPIEQYANAFNKGLADAYLVYLRQHEFPSPLLDWTKCPYTAAFFAYRKREINNRCCKNAYVSIHAYVGRYIDPDILVFNSFQETCERDKKQQAEYMICLQSKENIAKHEDVFSKTINDPDKLYNIWKFNLPVSQRINFLKKLDSMNINAFSLFGTKESLMETIALREIDFKGDF